MLVNSPDADGLNDRQLFDFPPDRDVYFEDLKVPMPVNTTDLKEVFVTIMEEHMTHQLYTFDSAACEEYKNLHDELVREKLKTNNEKAEGILSKARGYAARIAMIIHTLEQALHHVNHPSEETSWQTAISSDSVKAASVIIKHFNNQKLIMLGQLENEREGIDDGGTIQKRVARMLTMGTKNGDGVITPSDISQKHISEKVGTSYPTSKAIELIEIAVERGFGKAQDYTTPNKRSSTRFLKRPFSDLSNLSKETLKKACITEEQYNRAFSHPGMENSFQEEHD